MPEPVKKLNLDLSQIGEADKRNLCSTFLDAIERFYDDPVNREKFKQWQAKRNQPHTQPTVN